MTGLTGSSLRLGEHRARHVVSFKFEGRQMTGLDGEPIAVALHAAGVKILSRSFKYHRPRGLRCVSGACPNCAMRVNGLPGVATCIRALAEGDEVSRENSWPNANRDALAVLDRTARLTPAGFQFRRFRRSPRVFQRWERLLAHAAGRGRLPSPAAAALIADNARWVTAATDVAVVGGGPAGLAAALAAAEAGARVTLVERAERLGGYLAVTGQTGGHRDLIDAVLAHGEIVIRPGATAIGWYEEGVLGVADDAGFLELRPRAVVLCTGTHENGLTFANSDRPGVFTGLGAETLVAGHGVLPGHSAVVLAGEPDGYRVAARLQQAGVGIRAVADCGPGGADEAPVDAVEGTATLQRATPIAIRGDISVEAIALRVGGSDGAVREVPCDTVVIAAGRRPADELLLQRGYEGGFELRLPEDTRAPREWGVAGSANGTTTISAAVEDGRAAGSAIACRLAGDR